MNPQHETTHNIVRAIELLFPEIDDYTSEEPLGFVLTNKLPMGMVRAYKIEEMRPRANIQVNIEHLSLNNTNMSLDINTGIKDHISVYLNDCIRTYISDYTNKTKNE